MPNTITGRIDRIGDTVQLQTKDGKTYLKREITIAAMRFDPDTGEQVLSENYPTFEFDGERCKQLDPFRVGEEVVITFALQGRKYTNRDGKLSYFTGVRGLKIKSNRAEQPQPPVEQPSYQTVYAQPTPPPPAYPGWDSGDNQPPF